MTNDILNVADNTGTYSLVRVSANGREVEIDQAILDALGIDPQFMTVEIHHTTKEEWDLF